MIFHQRPLKTIYDILLLTNSTLLTAVETPTRLIKLCCNISSTNYFINIINREILWAVFLQSSYHLPSNTTVCVVILFLMAKFTFVVKETKVIIKLLKNSSLKISFDTENTMGELLTNNKDYNSNNLINATCSN